MRRRLARTPRPLAVQRRWDRSASGCSASAAPEPGHQMVTLPRVLWRCMPVGSGAFEHEDAGAEHDGHIRDIEDSSAQGANPNVHEIDHHSIRDPIEEIGGATSYEQSHSEESPSGPAPPLG